MLDTTTAACAERGILFHVGEARRNLRCTVEMHMWRTMCQPLRYAARCRHSCRIFPCSFDNTSRISVWHGWMPFEGVVAHNLHCKGEMHRQCTKSLELHLHARAENS